MIRRITMAAMLVTGSALVGGVALAGTPTAATGAQAPVSVHSKRPTKKYCRQHPTDPRCKVQKR